MQKLKDKHIVVVGSTGKFGRPLVRALVAEGANVSLVARTASNLNALSVEVGKDKTAIIPADASKTDETESIFDRAETIFGPIEAIINCAGSWQVVMPDDSLEIFAKAVDTDFDAHLRLIMLLGHVAQQRFRVAKHGLLMTISSHVAERLDLPGNTAYATMKAGADRYMKGLRHDLQGSGARVCTISSSIINTPGSEGILNTPEKRAGAVQPEEISGWIIENFDNPDIPEVKKFHKETVV